MVFEGAPNGSQGEVKGDQGDKGTPREAKGEPHHTISCSFWPVVLSTSEDKWLALANSLAPFGDHRLATSKVFKSCPFLGSVDDVDLKVSNGDLILSIIWNTGAADVAPPIFRGRPSLDAPAMRPSGNVNGFVRIREVMHWPIFTYMN